MSCINDVLFLNPESISALSDDDLSLVDDEIRNVTLPRPGHADLAGVQKYGFNDKYLTNTH